MTYSNANFKIRIEFWELLHQFLMKTLVWNSLIKEQSLRNNSVFSVGRCSPRCRFILFFFIFFVNVRVVPFLPTPSFPTRANNYLFYSILFISSTPSVREIFFSGGVGFKRGFYLNTSFLPKNENRVVLRTRSSPLQ